MSHTISTSDDIYKRLSARAAIADQSVEELLQQRLLQWVVPNLPPDEVAELSALYSLSDDALWTITHEQMPIAIQTQMQMLMDENTQGTISPADYEMLTQLVERNQRLMLRKSEASAILTKRGYIDTPETLQVHG